MISLSMSNTYTVQCIKPDGTLRWEQTIKNNLTDEGLRYALIRLLQENSYNGTLYVGLKAEGSMAQSDTLASHPGWEEWDYYVEGERQELELGPVLLPASYNNWYSPALFLLENYTDISGIFLTTSKTGTSGILVAVADFPAPLPTNSGDTLKVMITVSMENPS